MDILSEKDVVENSWSFGISDNDVHIYDNGISIVGDIHYRFPF